MVYRPKNPRSYQLRATDCERAAHEATDPYERSLLLLAANRWRTFAYYYGAPPATDGDSRDTSSQSAR